MPVERGFAGMPVVPLALTHGVGHAWLCVVRMDGRPRIVPGVTAVAGDDGPAGLLVLVKACRPLGEWNLPRRQPMAVLSGTALTPTWPLSPSPTPAARRSDLASRPS